jgi:phospholipid/cholesterol/gamma-HCH transport system permease protein
VPATVTTAPEAARAVRPAAVADRVGEAGVSHLSRLGGMLALAIAVLRELARPPLAWRHEFLSSAVTIVRTTFWPITISVAIWGFSGPGLQAGNFLQAFGSIDRAGGFMVVSIVREFGTFVTAGIAAGMVGTMLTAELGTRRVRGELDALEVLGVDPVAAIVAPRTLAIVVVMMAMNVFALVFGVAGGYVASVGIMGGTTGAFLESFVANATFLDLAASVVKVGLFGFLIGIISSWHGLHAAGGAHGVGQAVNRAVVGSLLAVFAVNLVYTQWFLAAFPQVNVLR